MIVTPGMMKFCVQRQIAAAAIKKPHRKSNGVTNSTLSSEIDCRYLSYLSINYKLRFRSINLVLYFYVAILSTTRIGTLKELSFTCLKIHINPFFLFSFSFSLTSQHDSLVDVSLQKVFLQAQKFIFRIKVLNVLERELQTQPL